MELVPGEVVVAVELVVSGEVDDVVGLVDWVGFKPLLVVSSVEL